VSSPFVYQPAQCSALYSGPPERSTEKSDNRLPLSGLRLAVKDLFHMKGLPTAAGNPDWAATHVIPTESNSSVNKLLHAGAEFVGKTITDELAYSLHGKNIHYAALVNPAAPAHIPGGSSSGSAVATSAHLCDIGLGTDTGGSIRVPASYQGLWGLRSTHGAVPLDNMVALARSFDTVGWMTRDIATMESVSRVLIPPAETKVTHIPPRIGVVQHLVDMCAHSGLANSWLEQHKNAADFYPITKSDLDLEALDTGNTFRVLQGAQIWQQHGEWISQTQPKIADDIMLRLDWCKTIRQAQVTEAKRKQKDFILHMEMVFAHTDFLLIPTTPGVAPRCDADEASLANDRNALLTLTAVAGLAGLPQLHMPLFTLHNAPCGLSLVGKKGSDLALINLAKALVA